MNQKSKHNFNKKYQRKTFIDIAYCVSDKVILKHWIQSESEVRFKIKFQWSETKIVSEAFNSVHDLVFISLKNNPTMLPRLKRTTKKKIFHSSVNTFDMQVVGSMEEIGKSLT